MLDLHDLVHDRAEHACVEGFDAVRLRSTAGGLEATFVPAAGMVGASLRDAGDELLWRGPGVRRYARGGTTMGIPLLHPWANRLARDAFVVGQTAVDVSAAGLVQRDDAGLAINGLVGGSPHWRVVGGAALSAELDAAAQPGLLAGFPFAHRVRVDVALRDRTLRVSTTLIATGERPVPVAFGFHPYLRLPDIARERWHLELPAMEHLEVDRRGIPTGRSAPVAAEAGALGTRTFDDGYGAVPDGAEFVLAGAGRRVTVRLDEGYGWAQVFAPPTADVVCFEPMTAPTNALLSGDGLRLLAPGEQHVAVFSIAVERSAGPQVRGR